jgi:hypothetical protein
MHCLGSYYELYDLYKLPSILRRMKFKQLQWAGDVTSTGEYRPSDVTNLIGESKSVAIHVLATNGHQQNLT